MGNLAAKLLSSKAHAANHDMPPWLLMILEFSDWDIRFKLKVLSRQWKNNTDTIAFHRFLCSRLSIERAIYVPATLPPRYDWRTMFAQLYALRDLWGVADAVLTEEVKKVHKETWKIQVFARFRPFQQSDEAAEDACAAVSLPLHQRLAMIRMSHKLQRGQSVLKVLTQEGGWFQDKWTSLAKERAAPGDEGPDKENRHGQDAFFTHMDRAALPRRMRVGALPAESSKIVSKVMSCDPLFGRVVAMTPDAGLREFAFDSVLPATASQKSTYDTCVKALVVDMLNGFNATALVYGQTGSGKTYSMFGTEDLKADGRGIIPRACEEILHAIRQRAQVNQVASTLCVSYVEVYGDQVSDLLRLGARVGQSKVAAQRYVLSGAAEHPVQSIEDVYAALEKGDAQKRRAATAMNDRSTRAHSLFILTLHQARPGTDVTLRSRLFLADLGGSEQVKKSQVEAGGAREGLGAGFSVGFELGQRMREAVYINLGLLALKKCAEALNSGSAYVPYQDSKLTMLLSEGLGGNSKTSIVVCSSLNPVHSAETLATLRFGETCAKIELSARNNATMLAGVIEQLETQIRALEAEILRNERWEVRERRREDALAEEGTLEHAAGAVEVMKVSVVTGAERERQLLEGLLRQRSALLGSSALLPGEEAGAGKRVVGFGKEFAEVYGLGAGYRQEEEGSAENSRFASAAKLEELPAVLRAGKGPKSWATGAAPQSDEEVRKSAAQANKKRNKLAYSGISA